MRKLNVGCSVCLVLWIVLITGCSEGQSVRDPQVIINDAMEQIQSYDKIALYGTLDASIAGFTHSEPDTLYTNSKQLQWMKLNPGQEQERITSDMLLSMKELQAISKQITVNDERTNAETTVIQMNIDADEMKQMIKEKSLRKLEKIRNSTSESQSINNTRQMEKNKAIELAEKRLHEMLNTLQITAEYQMGVSRQTHEPKMLYVNMHLTYMNQGKQKEEVVKGTYEIKGFDKDVMIPQNLK